jgi:TfoX N-terminal domain
MTPTQTVCMRRCCAAVNAAAATLPRSEEGHRLARLADVAYDTELADRIRFLIGTGPGVTEKKMFGGLAFLVGGNMAISASGRGGALVRVDPDESSALIATATASEAVMGGRAMPGWLRVSAEYLETDQQLTEWVSRAVAYARSLPPKR